MAKKKSCNRAPIINGELSALYMDLFKMLKLKLEPQVARQLTNVLYAHYVANSSILQSLDNQNKPRNAQNQHSAADVFQILEGNELVLFSEVNALNTLSISEGVKVNLTTHAEFNTWQDAYTKAEAINQNHRNLSAYVIQLNGKYVVKVNNKSTANMVDRVNTEILSEQMRLIDNTLRAVGLDLSNLSFVQETFFGNKYNNLINWLKNTPLTNPAYLTKQDYKMLSALFLNHPLVDSLITRFSLDGLAALMYDHFRGNTNPLLTARTARQISDAMAIMLDFNRLGLDTTALQTASLNLTDNIKNNSADYNALLEFDKLNAKYDLSKEDIKVSRDNLKSLTRILAYAIKTLGTQARSAKAAGNTFVSDNYFDLVKLLDLDLSNKEYTASLANTLMEILDNFSKVLAEINTVIPLNADINWVLERGTLLRRAKQFIEIYQPVVDSIKALDTIERDITITDLDAIALQQEANRVSKKIAEVSTVLDASMEAYAKLAISLMMVENSELTIDLVWLTVNKDVSFMGRIINAVGLSNIPASVLVNYLNAARETRTGRIAEIKLRIATLVNTTVIVNGKKYTVDKECGFMYEKVPDKNGSKEGYTWYLLSEYDFAAHIKARDRYAASLRRRGISGEAFNLAMEQWEFMNTKEISVDNGKRTERVPTRMKADNPLDYLNPAERKVYDEFLALKAELETLVPTFALSLYRPPQNRKSAMDYKNPIKGLNEKRKDMFSIREDEEGLGVIETDDGEVRMLHTDITGKPPIPINFFLKLLNQSELLLNMPEGLLNFAMSAINYDAMSEIQDTIELLSDYISDKVNPEEEGKQLATGFIFGAKRFISTIGFTTGTTSNVRAILNNKKLKFLYNDNTLHGIGKKGTKRANFIRRLASIKALTFNVFGAGNNFLEAARKTFGEALGGDYNPVDLGYAYGKMGIGHVGKFPQHMLDFFSGEKTTTEALLAEYFDVGKDKFREIANTKFRTNLFRKAASVDLSMIMYSWGETFGKLVIMHSSLHHEKALLNGKKVRLSDCFEVGYNIDGSRKLAIKQGATLRNGDPITEKYLKQLKRNMLAISERTLGGMSDEALGEIGSHLLGAMTLHLRRWMIGVYGLYFRGTWYDASTGKRNTGAFKGAYDTTLGAIINAGRNHGPWGLDWTKDIQTFTTEVIKNYKSLRKDQIRGAIVFLRTMIGLTILSLITDAIVKSWYPSDKDEMWFKILYYYLFRLRLDMQPTAPDLAHLERIGLIGGALIELADKPFSGYSAIHGFLYPITGLPDIGEEIQSGTHEGEDRYVRNITKEWLIPVEVYNKIMNISDTNDLLESLGGKTRHSVKKEYERLTGEKVDDKKKKEKVYY